MSRNGAGVFNLPSGNPYVTGTVISSSVMNTTMTQIATALTQSIAVDGQSVITNNIPFANNKITGLGSATQAGDALAYGQANWSLAAGAITGALAASGNINMSSAVVNTFYGTDVASAATIDLDAATGNIVNITGTTEIDAVTLTAGRTRIGRFTGILLLKNSASLVIQGGVDITTSANSFAQFISGPSNIVYVQYFSASSFPVVSPPTSSVRQSVPFGPVDSNGFATFGGATGTTTVTVSGTLIVNAANGDGALGPIGRNGTAANPSWTGLSTNGRVFLYLDIATDGSCTTGSGLLAPVYQYGGTYSTTSGQFTFDYQEMIGKVGNGASAVQTYRVYVGEVTVASNVVTAITWYQLRGRYDSGFTNTLPSVSTKTSKNHNLGVTPQTVDFIAECLTGEGGFATGDQISIFGLATSDGSSRPMPFGRTSLTAFFGTGNTAAFFGMSASGSGGFFTLTAANWKWKIIASRGW